MFGHLPIKKINEFGCTKIKSNQYILCKYFDSVYGKQRNNINMTSLFFSINQPSNNVH